MRQGFTLIEVIIGLLISSILSVTIYQLFMRTSKSVTFISKTIDFDEPLIPLFNQLKIDLTGMFIPQSTANAYLEMYLKEEKKDKDKSKEEDEDKNLKKDSINNKEEKKEKKFIKDVFYVKQKSSDELVLSFITTGGIQILEFDGKIKPVPFVRRVAYILQKDQEKSGTKKLIYRFETDKLDVQAIENPKFSPSYELLKGIKDFKIELFLFEEKEGDKNEKQEKKIKGMTEWNAVEVFKKNQAVIPAYIKFSGSYKDVTGKLEYLFEFDFKIPSYRKIKKKKKEEEPKKSPFEKLVHFLDKKMPATMKAPGNNGAKMQPNLMPR